MPETPTIDQRAPRGALDTRDTAEYISIAPATLKKWRVTGVGPPYVRAGARVVYRVVDLDAWLEDHLVGGGGRR